MATALDLTAPGETHEDVASRETLDSRPMNHNECESGGGFRTPSQETRRLESAGPTVTRGPLSCLPSIFAKGLAMLAAVFLMVAFHPKPAAAQAAKNLICNGCVGSKDVKNNGIRSADIKNGQVKRADVANNAIDSAKVVNDSLTSDDLATDSVTADEIADLTRNVSFPARAISFGSSVITAVERGLQWQQNFTGQGRVTFMKPSDYDGGETTFKIFFFTTTATAGAVDFFIEPDSFNSGEAFFEIGPIGASAVLVSGGSGFGNLYEQSFDVPANRLQKDWWTFNIQRQGNESTYTDDVVVMSVSLEYQAVQ